MEGDVVLHCIYVCVCVCLCVTVSVLISTFSRDLYSQEHFPNDHFPGTISHDHYPGTISQDTLSWDPFPSIIGPVIVYVYVRVCLGLCLFVGVCMCEYWLGWKVMRSLK